MPTVANALKRKGENAHQTITVTPETSIQAVTEILSRHGIGAVVISPDDKEIAGILSERDVVRRIAQDGDEALRLTAADLMTRDVITCTGEDRITTIMSQMTRGRFRHVPVVDERGQLAGLISIGDVVKSRLSELKTEAEALKDYISHGY